MTPKPAQSIEALDKANHVRAYRSELRRSIRADRDYRTSRRLLAQVLVKPIPAELTTLPVVSLLCWGYNLPHGTAIRLLHAAGATSYVHVGQLTFRQRLEMAVLLDGGPHVLADAELARQLWDLP